MKEKAILLVHGMGTFTAPAAGKHGSFGQSFIDATTATFQEFAAHQNETLEDYCDIHEVNYSEWFDKMRTEMADRAKTMEARLAAISGFYGAAVPFKLAEKLTGIESGFGGNDFFDTHWLDVVFYATMLGEKVRIMAAEKIAKLVEDYEGSNVHIVAHSLGTAVIHDTLYLLYNPESRANVNQDPLRLVEHKLGSLWMVANVSRLVNRIDLRKIPDPLTTLVKPGDGGCTAAFFNVHHQLDPFTWLAPFDPQNTGEWIRPDFYRSFYKNIVTKLIVDADTHSFSQYIQDPEVVKNLFPVLLFTDFKGTDAEMKTVSDRRIVQSVEGAYAALEQSLNGVKEVPGDSTSWQKFFDAVKKIIQAIQHIKNTFPGA